MSISPITGHCQLPLPRNENYCHLLLAAQGMLWMLLQDLAVSSVLNRGKHRPAERSLTGVGGWVLIPNSIFPTSSEKKTSHLKLELFFNMFI